MRDNNNLAISKIEQMSNSIQLLYLQAKNGEVEISKISLLKIIEDYLAYLLITHSASVNLEIVANFLLVVSELILWKSNQLLPPSQNKIDEEIEIEDDISSHKEAYWIEYKKYQSLVKVLLEKELQQREIFLTCPLSDSGFEGIPQIYDYSELILALESVLIKKNDQDVIDFKDYELNIEKKMREIEEIFFKKKDKLTFSQIISDNCPKIEIIITFLSLLQLICQGKVDYLQTQNFGEIVFYRKENRKLKKQDIQQL
jgi:segregation and condensation protein A